MRSLLISFLFGTIFFIAGLLTLPHYGINWDTINHLPRGQAYLHYFLTGRKDYSDLPKFKFYWQKPESLSVTEGAIERSLYQSDATTFSWFMQYDGEGHPPLSDILSSLFNRVLFGKLRMINDIDSYRVYGIFLAAALVGLVFWWTSRVYDNFAGLIAAVSLALYPLFWSEAHFNIEKDIPESVFWSFFLFSLNRGIVKKNWKWILVSGVFFGLGLGTKFNILFSIFVILPWLIISVKKALFKNSKIILAAFAAAALGILIFIGTWPYLWPDPIETIGRVIGFYKEIGLTSDFDARFLGPFGINTYPLQWIIYTTPIVTLILAILGILATTLRFKCEKHKVSFLFLLWLVVPIIRVTWPGTTIYGGTRQIMEYVPAMAILAGLGAKFLLDFAKSQILRVLVAGVIILSFLFFAFGLSKIHPNENVYFNQLIGGLAGAREVNLPAWGNSFGAAYRQGVVWLNGNAEENSKIAYARELAPNIPKIWLRSDLDLSNGYRSGDLRLGEYIIALTYEGTSETSYFDRYLEIFLEPIYKVEVDGVAILKVWKNDGEHTYEDYLEEEELEGFEFFVLKDRLRFDLKQEVALSKLEASFFERKCQDLASGYVQISQDDSNWTVLPGSMPGEDWSVPQFGDQPQEGRVLIPFAADRARFIEVVVSPQNTCLKKIDSVSIKHLPKVE